VNNPANSQLFTLTEKVYQLSNGISRILLSYALLIPFHIFCASFSIPHTGVTVLDFAQTTDTITAPRCLMLSDLSHLFLGRMKNKYNNSFDV